MRALHVLAFWRDVAPEPDPAVEAIMDQLRQIKTPDTSAIGVTFHADNAQLPLVVQDLVRLDMAEIQTTAPADALTPAKLTKRVRGNGHP